MRVSIIITSHNYADYLATAISSALNQTHEDTEVIVVDDGSTDASRTIIESFGDRVIPIYKDNGGQCSCLNTAIPITSGEIVMLLDADDELLPEAAALHAKEFTDGHVIKSGGYLEVIDTAGQAVGQRIPRQLPPSGNYKNATLLYGLDAVRNTFSSGQAWSRAFLLKVLPLPEHELIGADGYLTAVDRFFGNLAFIHQPVGRYRRHDLNKGPVRFRFTPEYMRNRIERKQHRIEYALEWIERLNLETSPQNFRRLRD